MDELGEGAASRDLSCSATAQSSAMILDLKSWGTLPGFPALLLAPDGHGVITSPHIIPGTISSKMDLLVREFSFKLLPIDAKSKAIC